MLKAMATFCLCAAGVATVLAAGAASAAKAADAASFAPMVTLDAGPVRGEVEQGLWVFRGIPYAAPPVGALRWRPPGSVAHWSGVRDATAFGAACPQPVVSKEAWAQVGPTSEDCLFLNVWRPTKANRPLPVMVFLHGGAFSLGSSGVPLYDGAHLAARGVVLVTLNYRLGRLGFFAHPALTAEDPRGLLGNYGLLDMVAALEWVQRNITRFGGDPRNVTLFGESAGAGAVQVLMASPEVPVGLFTKAISESGSGGEALPAIRGEGSPEAEGKKWTDSLGIPDITLAAMRALPADKVATAGGFPMIDGRLIRHAPGDAFNRNEQKHMPLLIGSNSFEASLPFYSDAVAREVLGTGYADILDDYRRGAGENPGPEANLRGDVDAVLPSRTLADQQARTGSPSFVYYFKQLPLNLRGVLPSAPHGGELAFLFGNQPAEDRWDDSDRLISRRMGDYWVQFAKTGNPNLPQAPAWRPVTATSADYMVFDAEARMATPSALEEKTKQATLEGNRRVWAGAHQ